MIGAIGTCTLAIAALIELVLLAINASRRVKEQGRSNEAPGRRSSVTSKRLSWSGVADEMAIASIV